VNTGSNVERICFVHHCDMNRAGDGVRQTSPVRPGASLPRLILSTSLQGPHSFFPPFSVSHLCWYDTYAEQTGRGARRNHTNRADQEVCVNYLWKGK
jgi:hypothetical protein